MTVISPAVENDWSAFCADPCERTFRPFYEKTRALAWTLCLRILRNEEDAADAIQSAYCRLLKMARAARGQAGEEVNPRQLVYRTVIREANNLRLRRSRRARKEIAVDRLPWDASIQPDAGNLAEQSLLRDRVERIVDRLPERYRLPIVLHYYAGLTHREVAEAIGAPVSTVSNRISRAHRKLEPMLKRAGLGGVALVLSCIRADAALLDPPAALTARAVYVHAAATAGAGSLTLPVLPSISVKPMAGTVALLLLTGGIVIFTISQISTIYAAQHPAAGQVSQLGSAIDPDAACSLATPPTGTTPTIR